MILNLDFNSDVPIYTQIREQIIKSIASGDLKINEFNIERIPLQSIILQKQIWWEMLKRRLKLRLINCNHDLFGNYG